MTRLQARAILALLAVSFIALSLLVQIGPEKNGMILRGPLERPHPLGIDLLELALVGVASVGAVGLLFGAGYGLVVLCKAAFGKRP